MSRQSKALERALSEIEPLRDSGYYGRASAQVVAAFHDGGPKRARAKARIIRDTWDTGVGVGQ